MRLDDVLRAHPFSRVERPPELWDADTQEASCLALLGGMISAAASAGAAPDALTLNVSNVVVEADDDDEGGQDPPPGEYVALTVSGPVDFGADSRWSPYMKASGVLNMLEDRLLSAGARFAYVRRIPPAGSITAFLRRLAPAQRP